MNDKDLENIIAFLFQRAGKSKLSFSELYLALSMKLNWFTPSDAKAIVNHAIQRNLLVKDEKQGLLKPGFPQEDFVPPAEFHPPKDLLEKTEAKETSSLFEDIIQTIAEKTNRDRKELQKKALTIAEEKQVTPETGALLLGKKIRVETDKHIEEVEKQLLTENEE